LGIFRCISGLEQQYSCDTVSTKEGIVDMMDRAEAEMHRRGIVDKYHRLELKKAGGEYSTKGFEDIL